MSKCPICLNDSIIENCTRGLMIITIVGIVGNFF